MSETASAPTPPPSPLLSLPQELRDYIYTLCAQATPKSYGPLEGYVEPSTELLKVNRQIRTEYQAVFYKLLPEILNQNRVCLKLPTGGKYGQRSEGKKFCCGWHLWKVPGVPWYERDQSSGQRRLVEGGLQIWVHQVPEEGESALRWWMDLYQVSEDSHTVSGHQAPPLLREVKELAELLGKVAKHSRVDASRLMRVGRVQRKLQTAMKREDQERAEKGIGSMVGSMSSLRVRGCNR